MKRTILSTIFLLVFFGLIASPALNFDDQIQMVGNVKMGSDELKTVDYFFQNTGTTDLQIHMVMAACQCITVKYPSGLIPAGEHGLIRVSLDPSELTTAGHFETKITINTNAKPANATLLLYGLVYVRGTEPFLMDGHLESTPGKWSYINKKGETVIPSTFDWAASFSEGRGLVMKNERWYHIDKTGQSIHNGYKTAWDFSNGYARVQDDTEMYGFIDLNGKQVLTPNFDYAGDFSDGLAKIVNNGKTYYLTTTLKRLVPKVRDLIESRGASNGRIAYKNKDGRWGFMNYEGKVVIEPRFVEVHSFYEGLAVVKKDKKYGYINLNGELVIPYKYDYADDFSEGKAFVDNITVINNEGTVLFAHHYNKPWAYHNDLSAVSSPFRRSFGFIDSVGQLVIDHAYWYVGNFHEGLAYVMDENLKSGFINIKGEFVLPQIYADASDFSEGLAPVILDEDLEEDSKSTQHKIVETEVIQPDRTVQGTGKGLVFFLQDQLAYEVEYGFEAVNGKATIEKYQDAQKKERFNAEVKDDEPATKLIVSIRDFDSKRPLNGVLKFELGEVFSVSSEFERGVVFRNLPMDTLLEYEVSANGYLPKGGVVYLNGKKDTLEFFLHKLEEGKAIVLENILFEQNDSKLKEASKKELDLIASMMIDNPTMEVFIAGHTDYGGIYSQSQELSDDRVKTVTKYLNKQGVSKRQVEGKGYGEDHPIYKGSDRLLRQKNRRVEFKVIKL